MPSLGIHLFNSLAGRKLAGTIVSGFMLGRKLDMIHHV